MITFSIENGLKVILQLCTYYLKLFNLKCLSCVLRGTYDLHKLRNSTVDTKTSGVRKLVNVTSDHPRPYSETELEHRQPIFYR